LILSIVVLAIAAPSIRWTAIFGAVPLVLANDRVVVFGVETKHKQLERITARSCTKRSASCRASARSPWNRRAAAESQLAWRRPGHGAYHGLVNGSPARGEVVLDIEGMTCASCSEGSSGPSITTGVSEARVKS